MTIGIKKMETINKKNNFLLVLNKKAGKSVKDSKINIIENYLIQNRCSYRIIDVDDLPQEKNLDNYDAVVAVGGDGTVLKVISRIVNTNARLGIIPCGTANLFAASLSISCNIQKALDILIYGSTANVDIGKAGEEFFALRVGIGFDADVVNGATQFWKKKIGYFAYLIQGIVNSFKLSRKSYKLTIDNKTITVNANSIIVANSGNMFRNLFTVAPFGSVIDGKLDIFILLAKNLWDFLIIFMQILLGTHKLNSKVIYCQAQNIKIEAISKNIHIDGEPYSNANLDISILPKALMVMVP